MSRQRFIYPEIFSSEDFMSLSLGARLLFIGLFTLADDWGRGKASTAALKAGIFPGDEVSRDQAGTWADEVRVRGMVRFYRAQGGEWYDIPSWDRWQTPKYKAKSRVPEFQANSSRPPRTRAEPGRNLPGTRPASAAERREEGRGGVGCGGVLPSPKPPQAAALGGWLALFPEFWEVYPRKVARRAAERAWKKLAPTDPALVDQAATAIANVLATRKRHDWAGRDPDRIPYPATFLNAETFEVHHEAV